MTVQEQVARILAFLRQQPTPAVDWTDEPYMRFGAELQDWSFLDPGTAILTVGYWFEQNGDLVADPNITFTLNNDAVVDVKVSIMGGPLIRGSPHFVSEFLTTVWDNHFARRVGQD